MKPFRTFIFFLAVLLLLFLVTILFPQQGIGIGGDLRLSFMSLSDLNRNDSTGNAVNVEELLSKSMVTDDPESDAGMDLSSGFGYLEDTIRPLVVPANVDSLKQNLYRIQFAEGRLTLLHSFFTRPAALFGLRGYSTPTLSRFLPASLF